MYNGKSNMCQNYNNDSIDSPLDKTAVILFGIDNIKKKGNNPELKNIKNNITIDQLKPFILPEPSIKWVTDYLNKWKVDSKLWNIRDISKNEIDFYKNDWETMTIDISIHEIFKRLLNLSDGNDKYLGSIFNMLLNEEFYHQISINEINNSKEKTLLELRDLITNELKVTDQSPHNIQSIYDPKTKMLHLNLYGLPKNHIRFESFQNLEIEDNTVVTTLDEEPLPPDPVLDDELPELPNYIGGGTDTAKIGQWIKRIKQQDRIYPEGQHGVCQIIKNINKKNQWKVKCQKDGRSHNYNFSESVLVSEPPKKTMKLPIRTSKRDMSIKNYSQSRKYSKRRNSTNKSYPILPKLGDSPKIYKSGSSPRKYVKNYILSIITEYLKLMKSYCINLEDILSKKKKGCNVESCTKDSYINRNIFKYILSQNPEEESIITKLYSNNNHEKVKENLVSRLDNLELKNILIKFSKSSPDINNIDLVKTIFSETGILKVVCPNTDGEHYTLNNSKNDYTYRKLLCSYGDNCYITTGTKKSFPECKDCNTSDTIPDGECISDTKHKQHEELANFKEYYLKNKDKLNRIGIEYNLENNIINVNSSDQQYTFNIILNDYLTSNDPLNIFKERFETTDDGESVLYSDIKSHFNSSRNLDDAKNNLKKFYSTDCSKCPKFLYTSKFTSKRAAAKNSDRRLQDLLRTKIASRNKKETQKRKQEEKKEFINSYKKDFTLKVINTIAGNESSNIIDTLFTAFNNESKKKKLTENDFAINFGDEDLNINCQNKIFRFIDTNNANELMKTQSALNRLDIDKNKFRMSKTSQPKKINKTFEELNKNNINDSYNFLEADNLNTSKLYADKVTRDQRKTMVLTSLTLLSGITATVLRRLPPYVNSTANIPNPDDESSTIAVNIDKKQMLYEKHGAIGEHNILHAPNHIPTITSVGLGAAGGVYLSDRIKSVTDHHFSINGLVGKSDSSKEHSEFFKLKLQTIILNLSKFDLYMEVYFGYFNFIVHSKWMIFLDKITTQFFKFTVDKFINIITNCRKELGWGTHANINNVSKINDIITQDWIDSVYNFFYVGEKNPIKRRKKNSMKILYNLLSNQSKLIDKLNTLIDSITPDITRLQLLVDNTCNSIEKNIPENIVSDIPNMNLENINLENINLDDVIKLKCQKKGLSILDKYHLITDTDWNLLYNNCNQNIQNYIRVSNLNPSVPVSSSPPTFTEFFGKSLMVNKQSSVCSSTILENDPNHWITIEDRYRFFGIHNTFTEISANPDEMDSAEIKQDIDLSKGIKLRFQPFSNLINILFSYLSVDENDELDYTDMMQHLSLTHNKWHESSHAEILEDLKQELELGDVEKQLTKSFSDRIELELRHDNYYCARIFVFLLYVGYSDTFIRNNPTDNDKIQHARQILHILNGSEEIVSNKTKPIHTGGGSFNFGYKLSLYDKFDYSDYHGNSFTWLNYDTEPIESYDEDYQYFQNFKYFHDTELKDVVNYFPLITLIPLITQDSVDLKQYFDSKSLKEQNMVYHTYKQINLNTANLNIFDDNNTVLNPSISPHETISITFANATDIPLFKVLNIVTNNVYSINLRELQTATKILTKIKYNKYSLFASNEPFENKGIKIGYNFIDIEITQQVYTLSFEVVPDGNIRKYNMKSSLINLKDHIENLQKNVKLLMNLDVKLPNNSNNIKTISLSQLIHEANIYKKDVSFLWRILNIDGDTYQLPNIRSISSWNYLGINKSKKTNLKSRRFSKYKSDRVIDTKHKFRSDYHNPDITMKQLNDKCNFNISSLKDRRWIQNKECNTLYQKLTNGIPKFSKLFEEKSEGFKIYLNIMSISRKIYNMASDIFLLNDENSIPEIDYEIYQSIPNLVNCSIKPTIRKHFWDTRKRCPLGCKYKKKNKTCKEKKVGGNISLTLSTDLNNAIKEGNTLEKKHHKNNNTVVKLGKWFGKKLTSFHGKSKPKTPQNGVLTINTLSAGLFMNILNRIGELHKKKLESNGINIEQSTTFNSLDDHTEWVIKEGDNHEKSMSILNSVLKEEISKELSIILFEELDIKKKCYLKNNVCLEEHLGNCKNKIEKCIKLHDDYCYNSKYSTNAINHIEEVIGKCETCIQTVDMCNSYNRCLLDTIDGKRFINSPGFLTRHLWNHWTTSKKVEGEENLSKIYQSVLKQMENTCLDHLIKCRKKNGIEKYNGRDLNTSDLISICPNSAIKRVLPSISPINYKSEHPRTPYDWNPSLERSSFNRKCHYNNEKMYDANICSELNVAHRCQDYPSFKYQPEDVMYEDNMKTFKQLCPSTCNSCDKYYDNVKESIMNDITYNITDMEHDPNLSRDWLLEWDWHKEVPFYRNRQNHLIKYYGNKSGLIKKLRSGQKIESYPNHYNYTISINIDSSEKNHNLGINLILCVNLSETIIIINKRKSNWHNLKRTLLKNPTIWDKLSDVYSNHKGGGFFKSNFFTKSRKKPKETIKESMSPIEIETINTPLDGNGYLYFGLNLEKDSLIGNAIKKQIEEVINPYIEQNNTLLDFSKINTLMNDILVKYRFIFNGIESIESIGKEPKTIDVINNFDKYNSKTSMTPNSLDITEHVKSLTAGRYVLNFNQDSALIKGDIHIHLKITPNNESKYITNQYYQIIPILCCKHFIRKETGIYNVTKNHNELISSFNFDYNELSSKQLYPIDYGKCSINATCSINEDNKYGIEHKYNDIIRYITLPNVNLETHEFKYEITSCEENSSLMVGDIIFFMNNTYQLNSNIIKTIMTSNDIISMIVLRRDIKYNTMMMDYKDGLDTKKIIDLKKSL